MATPDPALDPRAALAPQAVLSVGPDFLTAREVAEKLRVSQSEVYRLCAVGELPCYRIGARRGRVRIRPADLAAFIERSRGVPKPCPFPGRQRPGFKEGGFVRLRAAGWRPGRERGLL